MYSLLIDTHDTKVTFALYKDGLLQELIEKESKMRHSEIAMPTLIDLLNNNKIDIKDIGEILVVIGPGSFTGVRIGVVIAKTIAYLLNIPIKCLTSLDIVVFSNKNIIPGTYVINEKNGYFVGKYDNKGTLVEEIKYYSKKEFENANISDIIETDLLDYNYIYSHSKNKPIVNPHLVNPLYIKQIEVLK
jgi:tRNA threonylcarbamoyl adenosine modification protein YeaZ